MKQLYLIDAYALIYRAYFPFKDRPRLDRQGRNTSAVYGFVNILNDILNSFRPEYIAVVFDPPGGSFRQDFYPEYKANREATPEAIRFGVPYIKELVQALGISIVEVARYEADDVIGTLSVRAEQAGYEVLMVTPDKDYGQLVTEKVSILAPMQGGGYEELGVRDICNKFAVAHPRLVIDMLGMMGDTADNFPGIKGVGIKTAAKLLEQYGSLEQILEHADELKGALGEKVRSNKAEAEVSKRLATIALDVPIEIEIDSLARQHPDMAKVQSIMTELELRTQLKRMIDMYGKAQVTAQSDLFSSNESLEGHVGILREDEVAETMSLDYECKDLLDEGERSVFLQKLAEGQTLYIYSLLIGERSTEQEMLSIALVVDELPIVYHLSMRGDVFSDPIPVLRSLFDNIPKGVKVVGYDLKALILWLAPQNISLEQELEDTMIAHYLLMPDMGHQLTSLVARYLGQELMTYDELIAPQKPSKLDTKQISEERIKDYTSSRAYALSHLHPYLIKELEKREQYHLLRKLEMPLMPILASMEREGIAIDKEELKRQELALEQELVLIEERIHKMAGREFNINSPRQVGEILFDELGLDDKAKKTKTGVYTTSEEVLEKYRDKHPIVAEILEYRGYRKLLSTYIQALPELADSRGKIHSSFNQTVAATGRLSSSNPNIQNIPIRTPQGRAIRAAFVPNEGELFLSADYSQIELRLMAHFSCDPALIEAFAQGQDIHQATAARISGVSLEEVTSDMRRQAKTANFGIIYGVSAFGLAEQLAISRSEAKEIINNYFASYPSVERYMQEVVSKARSLGYVSTLLGRRRYLNDIDSNNAVLRGYAERNAINAPLQGTAADLIKQAMIDIDCEIKKRGLKSRMLLQVHDELNFSVPPSELEEMQKLVGDCMRQVGKDLAVPLEVGMGVGKNWLEAH